MKWFLIGAKLREMRVRHGLTMAELAKKTGWSPRTSFAEAVRKMVAAELEANRT